MPWNQRQHLRPWQCLKVRKIGVTNPRRMGWPSLPTQPGRRQLRGNLSVKDDCERRPLTKRVADDISWTGCPSPNEITPLFREGCVCCPALARLRGNFASKLRGWVGELKHLAEQPGMRMVEQPGVRMVVQPGVRVVVQPVEALFSWERPSESAWERNSAFTIHITEGWFCPHCFLTS